MRTKAKCWWRAAGKEIATVLLRICWGTADFTQKKTNQLDNFSYFWTRFCKYISQQCSSLCFPHAITHPFSIRSFSISCRSPPSCHLSTSSPVTVLWHCQSKLQIELLFPSVTSFSLFLHHPISLLFKSPALPCPNSLSFPSLFFHWHLTSTP